MFELFDTSTFSHCIHQDALFYSPISLELVGLKNKGQIKLTSLFLIGINRSIEIANRKYGYIQKDIAFSLNIQH